MDSPPWAKMPQTLPELIRKYRQQKRLSQAALGVPNPRLRFIFGANGGLGTARPTGKIRGRERCPACVAVATSAWRRPDRAVWADSTHRELSIHCCFGTERGGLHFVEEINRFEKLAEDQGAGRLLISWTGILPVSHLNRQAGRTVLRTANGRSANVLIASFLITPLDLLAGSLLLIPLLSPR